MDDVSDYRRRLAFLAGMKACRNGKARSKCNRSEGTIYFDDWHDGYSEEEQRQPLPAA